MIEHVNFIHSPQLIGNSLNLHPDTATSAITFDEEEQEEVLNMNRLHKRIKLSKVMIRRYSADDSSDH